MWDTELIQNKFRKKKIPVNRLCLLLNLVCD